MQEGAGVRQIVEDELRRQGIRLRDLDVRLELGLQESVRRAVEAGYGVTFISRTAVEADLEAGRLAEARVEGLEATREISLASRDRTSADAGGRRVRRVRSRAPRVVIVRWGLDELPALLDELGIERALLVTSRALGELDLPVAARSPACGAMLPSTSSWPRRLRPKEPTGSSASEAGARSTQRRPSAPRPVSGSWLCRPPMPASEWTPYFGMRDEARRAKTGGAGAVTVAVVYEPTLTLELPRAESVGTAMNALAHCAEALYARTVRRRSRRRSADRRLAPAGRRERRRPRRARTRLLEGAMHAGEGVGRAGDVPRRTRWRRRSVAATVCPTAR